jgi:hypothetical protein
LHGQDRTREQAVIDRLNTYAGDLAARIEPFDAIELELWRLWGRSSPQ